MPSTITMEIIMKKALLIFCMLLINNPLHAGNTKATLSDTMIVAGFYVLLLGPTLRDYIKSDEPRATLLISTHKGFYNWQDMPLIESDLCTKLIPELRSFTSLSCTQKHVDIALQRFNPNDPLCFPPFMQSPKDNPCYYKRNTCTVPDLDIMERIESTCQTQESKAKSLFSYTCPMELKEKNNARLKLRKKIIALQKERSGK